MHEWTDIANSRIALLLKSSTILLYFTNTKPWDMCKTQKNNNEEHLKAIKGKTEAAYQNMSALVGKKTSL